MPSAHLPDADMAYPVNSKYTHASHARPRYMTQICGMTSCRTIMHMQVCPHVNGRSSVTHRDMCCAN
eukprot:14391264-Alexandrium_andersonii.AAC.1